MEKATGDHQSEEVKSNVKELNFHGDTEVIKYTCNKLNEHGDKPNLKICSWVIEDLNKVIKTGGLKYFMEENADIIALQESTCSVDEWPVEAHLPGYTCYYATNKAGQTDVILYTKLEPILVKYSRKIAAARIILAEYSKFHLINVHVPMITDTLAGKHSRMKWDRKFRKLVSALNVRKPVIICGNMNVAHRRIDVEDPVFYRNFAGYTALERKGMNELLRDFFCDTYRLLYPNKTGAYTFWPDVDNARIENKGWRLSYFIVSRQLKGSICDNVRRLGVKFSQHCPIVLYIHL